MVVSPHACSKHHPLLLAAQAQDNDLVLVDAGAEVRCYTADITRTFPAGGAFTAAQRDVYNAVLAAQVGGGERGHRCALI